MNNPMNPAIQAREEPEPVYSIAEELHERVQEDFPSSIEMMTSIYNRTADLINSRKDNSSPHYIIRIGKTNYLIYSGRRGFYARTSPLEEPLFLGTTLLFVRRELKKLKIKHQSRKWYDDNLAQ